LLSKTGNYTPKPTREKDVSTELGEATGEKPIILQIKRRKCRWIGHTLRKTKYWIGIRREQKERKAEENLEKDRFVGSRKMQQNMEQGCKVSG
jgi:hypothetical protein